MDKISIQEYYKNNAEKFKTGVKKEEKLLIILSLLRLAIFLGGFVIIWIGFHRSVLTGVILLVLIAALFLLLLKIYSNHLQNKEHLQNLVKINVNEANAISGDYSAFDDGNIYIDHTHDYSYDLDLFGQSSIYQYLNRTSTGYGAQILSGWLLDPLVLEDNFKIRQETIKEIAAKTEWRQEFLATGMNKELEKSQIDGLVKWLSDDRSVHMSLLKRIMIWLLPFITLVSLGLIIFGLLHYSVFIFIFLFNLFIIALNLKKTNAIHNELSGRYRFLSSMGKVLSIFEKEHFVSRELTEIKSLIENSAVSSLRKLSRIIQAFDSRMNLLVGFIVNGLLLWDMHCIRKLIVWKIGNRDHFHEWLVALGKIDAYVSLGNYAFNNPDYSYPEISEEGLIFSAEKLGHQLIDNEKRVCNDFSLPAKGRICIITGANMAGKSTFLRTVAVNYIIAMTGAPVCAGRLSFLPMTLFTSMRTTDSLSSNESYFYAELKRLKSLKSRIQKGENILFMLDEILKGTNSEDKSTGSKLFLRKLIGLQGTGLVATHDTSLGTLQDEFPDSIINKCIEVEIDGEEIHFDYLLKDGITTKKNAVLLMKQMGMLE